MVQRELRVGYCIDTSALIDLWKDPYPPDVFPAIWKDLDELIDKGLLVAPGVVYDELSARDDDLLRWAKEHKQMFHELNEFETKKVIEIMKRYPKWVDHYKEKEVADPFIIALALGKGWTVVTSEKPNLNPEKPKIPDVCKEYNVNCINLLELFREVGWKYDR